MFSVWFIQKTGKENLFVKANHVYPQRNQHVKTLKDSRRETTEAEGGWLPCGAGRPHLQATRPPGPTCQPLLATSVIHRLKDYIYIVLLSWFDPRVQNGCYLIYIRPYTPLRRSIPETLIRIFRIDPEIKRRLVLQVRM